MQPAPGGPGSSCASRIVAQGHTDELTLGKERRAQAQAGSNLDLSRRRAAAFVRALVRGARRKDGATPPACGDLRWPPAARDLLSSGVGRADRVPECPQHTAKGRPPAEEECAPDKRGALGEVERQASACRDRNRRVTLFLERAGEPLWAQIDACALQDEDLSPTPGEAGATGAGRPQADPAAP